MKKLSTKQAISMNNTRWGKGGLSSKYPWYNIQKDHDDNKLSQSEICDKYLVSRGTLYRAIKLGLFVYTPPKIKRIVSEETKTKISNARKKFLKENPDKHPWRHKDKFQSKPCNLFKQKLLEHSIEFVEEYVPLSHRAYSIDIAFPDRKIGIEINGQQHYQKTGELKPYYQKRHDEIKNDGWTLHEIHYSLVWNDVLLQQIIENIKSTKSFISFNYLQYTKDRIRNNKKVCKDCGCDIHRTSIRCKKCNGKYRKNKMYNRNVRWIDEQTLQRLVWEKPLRDIAKDYNVSDVTIGKWCKKYNISVPPTGYWIKK